MHERTASRHLRFSILRSGAFAAVFFETTHANFGTWLSSGEMASEKNSLERRLRGRRRRNSLPVSMYVRGIYTERRCLPLRRRRTRSFWPPLVRERLRYPCARERFLFFG